jgi:hypothetical protein
MSKTGEETLTHTVNRAKTCGVSATTRNTQDVKNRRRNTHTVNRAKNCGVSATTRNTQAFTGIMSEEE